MHTVLLMKHNLLLFVTTFGEILFIVKYNIFAGGSQVCTLCFTLEVYIVVC